MGFIGIAWQRRHSSRGRSLAGFEKPEWNRMCLPEAGQLAKSATRTGVTMSEFFTRQTATPVGRAR